MEQIIDHALCRMSAQLFVLANKKGHDSVKFITSLFRSEVAPVFYNPDMPTNWLGATYVIAVLNEELHFEQGATYSDDFMYWAGYLYRAWTFLYQDSPEQIIEQAPPEVLAQMFTGLHVMSYQMAIQDLKELYVEKKKNTI